MKKFYFHFYFLAASLVSVLVSGAVLAETTSNTAMYTSTATSTTAGSWPGAPSNLVVRLLGNGADALITWTDNATNETEYRVFFRPKDGAWSSIRLSADAVSYIYFNQPIGIYEYNVGVCNSQGCSGAVQSAFTTRYEVPATSNGTATGTTTTSTAASSDTATTNTETDTSYSDADIFLQKIKWACEHSGGIPINCPLHPSPYMGLCLPCMCPSGSEYNFQTSVCEKTYVPPSQPNIPTTSPAPQPAPTPTKEIQQTDRGNRTSVTNIFSSRPELLIDTDKDGIPDYDEVNIYHTDPKIADSDKDGVMDGEEVLSGANPLVKKEPARYEYPKDILIPQNTLATASLASLFTVEKIEVASTTVSQDGIEVVSQIRLEGRAPPNSFVTLYIYSTPLVVTVKADNDGKWTYVLDKELPDGKHEVYVAMTDGNGKILAGSNPIPFVKEALAVSLESNLIVSESAESPAGFFNRGMLIVLGMLLVGIVGAALLMLGFRKKEEIHTL